MAPLPPARSCRGGDLKASLGDENVACQRSKQPDLSQLQSADAGRLGMNG